MKKQIKIKFINGISYDVALREILNCVTDNYDFIESSSPDYILFGPYGNDIPPKGNYVRIAYYCENFKPDMSICEWAFGVPYETEVDHPKYLRIQWHGFDPNCLVKQNIDLDRIIETKTRFCNFVYSNSVHIREDFFQRLSKYKHIDAPGKSMNNMNTIDGDMTKNIWQRKQEFLSNYKFTIAMENYSYPGYNTEKLLDPMLVNSLPIYLGNPKIHLHFNTNSFINAHEYIGINNSVIVNSLQYISQPDFKDIRLGSSANLLERITRRSKAIGRQFKYIIEFRDFEALIELIIEVDRDDNLYAKYLIEPWYYDNTPPSNQHVINRWREIFE